MRKVLLAAFMLVSTQAYADCFGSSTYQTCYDLQSGNNYTIQRYGNTTMMQGSNSRTGSNWSQESYSFGNTTNHYGRDKDGNSWSTTCTGDFCY